MKHVERHFCYLCRFFAAHFWARLYCTCHATDMGSSSSILVHTSSFLTHTYTHALVHILNILCLFYNTNLLFECEPSEQGAERHRVDEWQVVLLLLPFHCCCVCMRVWVWVSVLFVVFTFDCCFSSGFDLPTAASNGTIAVFRLVPFLTALWQRFARVVCCLL